MPEEKVELPAEKAYYLLRTQIVQEIQGQLLAWAKQRVWIASAIAAFIGFIGINAIVTVSLYGLLKDDLRSAQQASVIAADAAAQARTATKMANSHVENLNVKAKDLDDRFGNLTGKLEAESINAKEAAIKEVELLGEKVDALDDLVSKLAKRSEDSAAALDEYQSTRREQQKLAESRRDEFSQNSDFRVRVFTPPSVGLTAKALVASLAKLGFKPTQEKLLRDMPEETVIVYTPESFEKAAVVQGVVSEVLGIPKGRIMLQEKRLWLSKSRFFSFSGNNIAVFLEP